MSSRCFASVSPLPSKEDKSCTSVTLFPNATDAELCQHHQLDDDDDEDLSHRAVCDVVDYCPVGDDVRPSRKRRHMFVVVVVGFLFLCFYVGIGLTIRKIVKRNRSVVGAIPAKEGEETPRNDDNNWDDDDTPMMVMSVNGGDHDPHPMMNEVDVLNSTTPGSPIQEDEHGSLTYVTVGSPIVSNSSSHSVFLSRSGQRLWLWSDDALQLFAQRDDEWILDHAFSRVVKPIHTFTSVSLSSNGHHLVVGNAMDDDGGAVHVFAWRHGTLRDCKRGNSWQRVGDGPLYGIDHVDGANVGDHHHRWGWKVSVSNSGHRVAIGGTKTRKNSGLHDDSHVTVMNYQRTTMGEKWVLAGTVPMSNSSNNGVASIHPTSMSFAMSSSSSSSWWGQSDRLVLGASSSVDGSTAWSVHVYDLDDWQRLQVIPLNVQTQSASLSSSVELSLSEDGGVLVVRSTSVKLFRYHQRKRRYRPLGSELVSPTPDDDTTVGGVFSKPKIRHPAVSLSADGASLALVATTTEEPSLNPHNNGTTVHLYDIGAESWKRSGVVVHDPHDNGSDRYVVSLSNQGERMAIASSSNDEDCVVRNGGGSCRRTGKVRIYEQALT